MGQFKRLEEISPIFAPIYQSLESATLKTDNISLSFHSFSLLNNVEEETDEEMLIIAKKIVLEIEKHNLSTIITSAGEIISITDLRSMLETEDFDKLYYKEIRIEFVLSDALNDYFDFLEKQNDFMVYEILCTESKNKVVIKQLVVELMKDPDPIYEDFQEKISENIKNLNKQYDSKMDISLSKRTDKVYDAKFSVYRKKDSFLKLDSEGASFLFNDENHAKYEKILKEELAPETKILRMTYNLRFNTMQEPIFGETKMVLRDERKK